MVTKTTVPGIGLLLFFGCLLGIPGVANAQHPNHSLIWTQVAQGETVYVDLVTGVDEDRATHPGRGSSLAMPYSSVQYAVWDVLGNPSYPASYPVVFNVHDSNPLTLDVHNVPSPMSLPARGVKLQTVGDAEIVLDGGGRGNPVIDVDNLGPDSMPATIIQGFTITGGDVGVRLQVQGNSNGEWMRTEVRDCILRGNLGGGYGGIGIQVVSFGSAPTQYVIEGNQIFDNGVWNESFAASWGIKMSTRPGALDSTLIRSNQIHDQETGISLAGGADSWLRPRILSNFLWNHEQHVWSVWAGPIFYHNTIHWIRDFSNQPSPHVIWHNAPQIPAGANPEDEQFGFPVRNCIFVHDYVVKIPTFRGTGTINVSYTDFENLGGLSDLRLEAQNYVNRFVHFVDGLHLNPNALQVESAELAAIVPGVTMTLGNHILPVDVRVDVDGDVRVSDQDRDTVLVPDRGADEVHGLRMKAEAFVVIPGTGQGSVDRMGNVRFIDSSQGLAYADLIIEGTPGETVIVQAWLDSQPDPLDDVVYNNVFLPPVGNLLLPQSGAYNTNILTIGSNGEVSHRLELYGMPEVQIYYQALGLSGSWVGTASNRVHLTLKN